MEMLKAQARAAILTGHRSVGLRERLEDEALLILRNADAGVAHGKVNLNVFACASTSTPACTDTPPSGVNLRAFPSRLTRIWRRRAGSPDHLAGNLGGDLAGERQALLRGLDFEDASRFGDQLVDVEGDVLEFHSAWLRSLKSPGRR